MALVESPVAPDGEPRTACHVQGQISRPDGPGEQRGVDHTQIEVGVGGQQSAGCPGLLLPLGGEVDVVPPGEEVLGVPERLTVAEEDQLRHAASVSRAVSLPRWKRRLTAKHRLGLGWRDPLHGATYWKLCPVGAPLKQESSRCGVPAFRAEPQLVVQTASWVARPLGVMDHRNYAETCCLGTQVCYSGTRSSRPGALPVRYWWSGQRRGRRSRGHSCPRRRPTSSSDRHRCDSKPRGPKRARE